MKNLGLALSGGGFRASLYHLGLLRFLRDAGLLSQVTHITSVSGGSIMAAHLALNWGRYTGKAEEFEAAASELLTFVGLDVRNRLLRRFPLALPLRWLRRLLGHSNRQLTLTGLLEYHYQRYLYGDKSLFELPEKPQLHILATNLSEGCLCSFTRDGLLMVRRQPGGGMRVDRIHVGLATVAMAVTASSAFPGFFPPLELTSRDVGAGADEFDRQAYIDGGVFDNLGVRMFHCLQRPLLAEGRLGREDFVDFQATVEALQAASQSAEETPLRRLAQILIVACRQPDLVLLPRGASNGTAAAPAIKPTASATLSLESAAPRPWVEHPDEVILSGLWNTLRHYQFRLDPLFAGLGLQEPEAEALLKASRLDGQPLEAEDQLWLNRHLLEAAFRQSTGRPCFRRLNSGLDGVLVSDVGKKIQVQSSRRAGGLIRTALRSSDILMDRVWQLENERFHNTQGFVFARMADVVDPAEDPSAMHPEVQRQVAHIRTDLDRFSPLEISTLVRHGYCVGRKACRAHPDLFGADLPGQAAWDPYPSPPGAASTLPQGPAKNGKTGAPSGVTREARTLQASALRRIWTTLLDRRDWVTYIYVPILVPLLVLLPYFTVTTYKHYHRLNQLVESFSQGTRDLETLNEMLEHPPAAWPGEQAERMRHLDKPNLAGFTILQDSRIIDLRNWKPGPAEAGAADSQVTIHRRMKVVREREDTGTNEFRLRLVLTSPRSAVRFPSQRLPARVRMSDVETSPTGEDECRWEAAYDFQGVSAGEYIDLLAEQRSPGQYLKRAQNGSSLSFPVLTETAELTMWLLMPHGYEYQHFRISRHEADKPEKTEAVRPVTEYVPEDSTILAFKLLSLKAGTTYELSWNYK